MADDRDFAAEIRRLAAQDLVFQARVAAGEIGVPEQKAGEAWKAERVARLDAARGIADVSYSQFREAFEAGAECYLLTDLKDRMHPQDPLREAAVEDLRGVGCYSRMSRRTESH